MGLELVVFILLAALAYFFITKQPLPTTVEKIREHKLVQKVFPLDAATVKRGQIVNEILETER